MKWKNLGALSGLAASLLFFAAFTVNGQNQNESAIANVIGGGSAIRWEISAANAGGTLTITFPDGRSVRKTLKAGASAQINLGEKYFENLPDGNYTYELQLAPMISAAQREALQKARAKDDDPENERAARKRSTIPGLVQSGSFAVVNGSIITTGAVEPETARPKAAAKTGQMLYRTPSRGLRSHHFSLFPDVVTADDSIIQGSECVGLDCVSGESFGFDTIRLKENNDRLQFDDTSTSAGFPANNWQIRANDSGSGGENFLGIVDQGTTGNSESGTVIFKVTAGASANSLKVASNSKVGFRTATPVLDLHMNTSDTPAVRFEQNNTGGFSAQTWDIGANEANFFVRDVTSGSRLPFRIRPGAPTSSIDISATGNVGIATASPAALLHVLKATDGQSLVARFQGGDNSGANDVPFIEIIADSTTDKGGQIASNSNGVLAFFTNVSTPGTLGTEVMRLTETSRVGIGTASPDQTLSVNGDASKTGGNTWLSFSDERLKNIKGNYTSGLSAVMRLQPLRYEYKPDNALGLKSEGEHIGFGAGALQKVIPEAVTKNSAGYLMVNSDPILWTMLNAIKEQQKEIADLKREIRKLKGTVRNRRK
jgi:endosialidase-like protein